MDPNTLNVYSIAILSLSIVILAILFYHIKVHTSREKKDDEITELRTTVEEMTDNGNALQDRANQLAEYYKYADRFVKDMLSVYAVYKQTGIDNIIKHKYFGDDPTIQHFIKETLLFDKNTITKTEEYNRNVQRIFTEQTEEEV